MAALTLCAGCEDATPPPTATDGVFLDDGRFVVAGHTGVTGDEEPEAWQAGFEAPGEARWQVAWGSARAPAVAVLPSGRLVVTTPGNLVALEPDGRPAWRREEISDTRPMAYLDPLPDVAVAADGDLIAVGTRIVLVPETDAYVPQPYLLRLAPDGSTRSMRGMPDLGALLDVVAADRDGGAIAAGAAVGNGTSVTAVALDAGGELRWAKTVALDEIPTAHDLVILADGGAAVALSMHATEAEDELADAAVLRLDENGELVWYRRWDAPGDEIAWRLAERPDGGLLVAATTTANATGGPEDTDLWLLELDADGGTEWQVLVASLDPDVPVAARALSDGSAEVLGQRGPDVERWVVDRDGALVEGCGVVWDASFADRPFTPAVEAIDMMVEDVDREDAPAGEPTLRHPPPLPVPICRE